MPRTATSSRRHPTTSRWPSTPSDADGDSRRRLARLRRHRRAGRRRWPADGAIAGRWRRRRRPDEPPSSVGPRDCAVDHPKVASDPLSAAPRRPELLRSAVACAAVARQTQSPKRMQVACPRSSSSSARAGSRSRASQDARRSRAAPQRRGVCTRVYTTPRRSRTPRCARSPASGSPAASRSPPTSPAIGHNLQEHSIVLVRGGRVKDLPGVATRSSAARSTPPASRTASRPVAATAPRRS